MRLRSATRLRLLCIDLENRPSTYWYDDKTTSQITAFGWKWMDERKPSSMLLQPDGCFAGNNGLHCDNVEAHAIFHGLLSEAGIVYGHNIRRHDLPIFQAWLLRHQLERLPRLLTSDTLRDYPKRKDMSASLENLVAMYGVKGRKFSMTQPMWEAANQLTPDGIALARRRVESDVILQERLYERLVGLGLLGTPRTWEP